VKAGGREKMTDEQAKETLEAVQAVLDEGQKATLERISLPRRRRSGGFGGGRGGGRGGQQPQDENPFAEAENHKSLVSLLKRHGVEPPKIEVKKAAEGDAGPAASGAGGEQSGSGRNIVEVLFNRFDKDGDKALSKDEVPEAFKSRFDRIDTNKDGKCDLKEFTAARQAARDR